MLAGMLCPVHEEGENKQYLLNTDIFYTLVWVFNHYLYMD